MSKKTLDALGLTEEMQQQISAKLGKLEEQGVKASEDYSGELNFSGCASGYCQAWA